jgi:hypothetical protein
MEPFSTWSFDARQFVFFKAFIADTLLVLAPTGAVFFHIFPFTTD